MEIKTSGGSGGGITGSGAAGQVTFWDGSSSVSGNANFLFDSTLVALRLGITAVIARTREKFSLNYDAASADSGSSHATLYGRYRNLNNTNFTSFQNAIVGQFTRTITTNTTDSGDPYGAFVALMTFSAAGSTLTHSGHAQHYLAQASSIAAGSTSIAHLSCFRVEASSAANTGRKYGFLCQALSGGTTANVCFGDSGATSASGDWSLYMGSSKNNHINGNIYVGATAVSSLFNAEKVSIQNSQASGATSNSGLTVIENITSNTVSSGSGNNCAIFGQLTRTITSSTTDTQGRTAAIVASLSLQASGVTYGNAQTNGVNFFATTGGLYAGTIAVDHFSLYYGSANSQAVTGTKYGLRLGSITGGTVNNFAIWTDAGVVSFNDYLNFRQNSDPGAAGTDSVRLGAEDASAGNRTFHFRTEAAVVGGAVSPDATIPIKWNGTVYNLCLKT